jgi:hypothetical protein
LNKKLREFVDNELVILQGKSYLGTVVAADTKAAAAGGCNYASEVMRRTTVNRLCEASTFLLQEGALE